MSPSNPFRYLKSIPKKAKPFFTFICNFIRKTINFIISNIINLLWPPRCLISDQIISTSGAIEFSEWQKLKFNYGAKCYQCGILLENVVHSLSLCGACIAEPNIYTNARAPLLYDDVSKKMVLEFKHAGRRDGLKTFALWMLQAIDNIDEYELIVPVPSHKKRIFQRGYNQAAWLAQAFANISNKQYTPSILFRNKNTKSQNGLSINGRARNVKGAFIAKKNIKGKNIILIDDVYTTGATLNACAKALKNAGANNILALTLLKVNHAKTTDIESPIMDFENAI